MFIFCLFSIYLCGLPCILPPEFNGHNLFSFNILFPFLSYRILRALFPLLSQKHKVYLSNSELRFFSEGQMYQICVSHRSQNIAFYLISLWGHMHSALMKVHWALEDWRWCLLNRSMMLHGNWWRSVRLSWIWDAVMIKYLWLQNIGEFWGSDMETALYSELQPLGRNLEDSGRSHSCFYKVILPSLSCSACIGSIHTLRTMLLRGSWGFSNMSTIFS